MKDAKDTKSSWYDWAQEQTDPEKASQKPEALDDLLVLDVSYGNVGGLACSSMLAELGAKVIRIEPPGGDVARQYSPFGIMHQGTGLGYLAEGRNKYQVTLDLTKPESREIFTTLAKHADVIIETFQPGVMDGWGIGYQTTAGSQSALDLCRLMHLWTIWTAGRPRPAGIRNYQPGLLGPGVHQRRT